MPSHGDFILAAYLITGLVLAGTVLFVWVDGRALRRKLNRLDERKRK